LTTTKSWDALAKKLVDGKKIAKKRKRDQEGGDS